MMHVSTATSAPDAPRPRKGRVAKLTPAEAKARAAAATRAWKNSPEGRAYYATHRAQINATARAWRARNRDKENARQRERLKNDPVFRARHRAADDKWRAKIDKKAYWKRIRDKQNADPVRRAQRKLWAKKAYEKYKLTPGGRAKRAKADENRRKKLAADAQLRERQRIRHREYAKAWRARKLLEKKERANEAGRRHYMKRTGKTSVRPYAPKPRLTNMTPEQRAAHQRALRIANQNKPEQLARAKAYRERTKDRQRERHRLWRLSQPDYKEKKRAYMVEYHERRRHDEAVQERIREQNRLRYARMRSDPVKLAAYKEASRRRSSSRTSSPRLEILPYPYRAAERSPMLASITKLIPKGLHPDVIADLCQELTAEIVAQVVTLEQLADRKVMRRYVTRANKQVLGDYGMLSLDDVIPGTDNLKRIDTIDSETSIYDATPFKR